MTMADPYRDPLREAELARDHAEAEMRAMSERLAKAEQAKTLAEQRLADEEEARVRAAAELHHAEEAAYERLIAEHPDPDLIVQAAMGQSGPDQARIARQGLTLVATLLRKNADYGGSAWKAPILAPDLPAASAILVRMSDKVERIARLAIFPAQVAESVEDTVRDLAGYCLLWLARPRPVDPEGEP